jgi:hypothetical protein
VSVQTVEMLHRILGAEAGLSLWTARTSSLGWTRRTNDGREWLGFFGSADQFEKAINGAAPVNWDAELALLHERAARFEPGVLEQANDDDKLFLCLCGKAQFVGRTQAFLAAKGNRFDNPAANVTVAVEEPGQAFNDRTRDSGRLCRLHVSVRQGGALSWWISPYFLEASRTS